MKLTKEQIKGLTGRVEELEKMGVPRDLIPTILLMEFLK